MYFMIFKQIELLLHVSDYGSIEIAQVQQIQLFV